MDTVDFLRPKFVLMENVVDLLKFADGFIGRYEIPSSIGYAGAYGLPQFRMRVFLWGACATEVWYMVNMFFYINLKEFIFFSHIISYVLQKPPQYPLPTHDVLGRGIAPVEFEVSECNYYS
jgi:DNA (cytosine-5)-methyltransferase 1